MREKQLSMVAGVQLWQWRNQAKESATQLGISPDEVDWLLREVAGLDKLALRLESFKDKASIQLKLPLPKLSELWQERINQRKPLQYLTGTVTWRNFCLNVSPAVLIPRPETELLIDLVLAAVERRETLEKSGFSPVLEHWVDLGTGSGAIALGLAEVFPNAAIHAVDFSSDALAIAQQNAQNLGFEEQIEFKQGFWWQPLAALKGQISGMVSNPPYIPSQIVPDLQPEVAQHEPHLALDGGVDGLECIRHLVETAPEYLCSGGIWLIEMMAGQAEAVRELLHNQGSYCQIEIHADLAGIERFALAYRV